MNDANGEYVLDIVQIFPDPHRFGVNDYSPDEKRQIKEVQTRADSVFAEYGRKSPEPDTGEAPFQYQVRLAQKLAKETPKYRNTDISKVPAGDFAPVEEKIYADALAQSKHPLDLKPGEVREIKKQDRAGRVISEFVAVEGAAGFVSVYGSLMTPAVVSPVCYPVDHPKAGEPMPLSYRG